MRMRLRFVPALLLFASCAVTAHAQCSNNKCTVAGVGYFADVVCTGGACNGSSNTDACPGHCNQAPAIECINNNPCNGQGDFCSFSTVFKYGHCVLNPRIACLNSGYCPIGDTCGPLDTTYAGDGRLTIYGTTGNDTITGTFGADVICGNNGNDIIWGNGVLGGNDILSGGNGNDTITGGAGDDIVHGDAGDDIIVGCLGRDLLTGDDGNDTVRTTPNAGGSCPNALPDADVVGSLLCGGKGNDILAGVGAGHMCLDAGADQSLNDGNNVDCLYQFSASRAQTALDLGTGKNCVKLGDGNTGASIPVGGESCGCGD